MRFDILSLFPEMFESVFGASIVRRAVEADRIEIYTHNIRDWTTDKHHVTDDTPYGGGGGMVMKPEPIVSAVEELLGAELVREQKVSGRVQVPVVMMSPAGQVFNQHMAREFECYGRMLIICGRYEGIDERVTELVVTHQVSIGDYVLSGGEIPAMAIVEAVTRLVPGVLGDMRAVIEDSHSSGLLEYPQYTRPPEYRGLGVPEALLSGNHALIERWRREQALARTHSHRPDMLDKAELSKADIKYLQKLENKDSSE